MNMNAITIYERDKKDIYYLTLRAKLSKIRNLKDMHNSIISGI